VEIGECVLALLKHCTVGIQGMESLGHHGDTAADAHHERRYLQTEALRLQSPGQFAA